MIHILRHLTIRRGRAGWALAATLFGALALSACSSGGTPTASTAATGTSSAATAATGQVLPVDADPIVNNATGQTLVIESVIVENNVDPATGNDASDHLEIALSNTGSAELGGFEVYYTFTDPTAGATEHYYVKLPDAFTIQAGGSRVVHFDSTGALDHFADNQFSLYHTSNNALDVTVEVSATNAAVQTATVQKDAGGSETAD